MTVGKTKVFLTLYLILLVVVFVVSNVRCYLNIKKIEEIKNYGNNIYMDNWEVAVKNPDGLDMKSVIIDGKPYLSLDCVSRLTGFGVEASNNTITLSKGKNSLNLSFFNKYDGPKMVEMFKEAYPKISINYKTVPNRDGEYENFLDSALKSGAGVPDVFAVESAFAKKYVNMPGTFTDLSDKAKEYTDNMTSFTIQVGTDKNGVLRALPYNVAPGAIAYKKGVAKKYLGTDDPENLAEMLSTPQKMLQTAKILKERSGGKVYLFPTCQEAFSMFMGGRSQGWVVNNKLTIDKKVSEFIDFAKSLRSNKYEAEYEQWSPEWSAAIYDDEKALAWMCPPWAISWVIGINDKKAENGGRWGLVKAAYPYFWGGTWYGIYSKSPNQDVAWEFIKYFTTGKEVMKRWAYENRDFPNNMELIKEGAPEGNKIMGTDIYKFFEPFLKEINGNMATEYDDGINSEFLKSLKLYLDASIRNKEELMDTFKKDVKFRFKDIIVQ